MAQKLSFWERGVYLVAVGAVFYSSYGFANWFTAQRQILATVPEIVFAWEALIPFWAWTILPYWSLNLLYALAFFLCRTRQQLHRYISQLLLAQLIAVTAFLLFPLQYSGQKPAVEGLFGELFAALASFDQPYNQAPSLHIILTVVVGAFYWRYVSARWRMPLLVWLGLIALSILTTYQHHFIDLPTGLWVGYFVLWALPYEQPSPLTPRIKQPEIRQSKPHHTLALRYFFAGLLIALPTLFGGAWLWLGWVTFSLWLVALAYGLGNPAIFQKQADGRLSVASRVLLLPYLIGVRVNMAFWLRGKARTSRVDNSLYIGSVLEAPHFSAVLDLCAEYPCKPTARQYVSQPMLDLVPASPEQLLAAAKQIACWQQQRQTVLVCCALGYGRSVAVVLVYLLTQGGYRQLDQAFAHLAQARPNIVLPLEMANAVRQAVALWQHPQATHLEEKC